MTQKGCLNDGGLPQSGLESQQVEQFIDRMLNGIERLTGKAELRRPCAEQTHLSVNPLIKGGE